MSSTAKPAESKKSKNSTYQSSTNNMNFNSSKNSKLSFTSALKNNSTSIKSKPHQTNSAKKRHSKQQTFPQHENNNSNIDSNIKENQAKNIENESKKNINEEDMKENQSINNDKRTTFKDEDVLSKKVLKSVDSFTSIGFLLPNKSNIIEKTDEKANKKKSNRRYANQEAYDFDGNIIYNNPRFGLDSSGKKRNIDIELTPNKSDDDDKNIKNYDNDSSNEEEMDKLRKQEELIKKLIKYKNF